MLTNKEYRTMLESGVSAGFLAIVESAYKVIFEAGGKTIINSMRPLSIEDVAGNLNIDTSDCVGPEGKVNWNAVSRKLYEDSRFAAVDMKVNAIVRKAMDLSGIKYVDESGNPVYAYPGLNKNAELTNIEENLKNGLKEALVKKYCDLGDRQKFIDLVNSISVDGAARSLSDKYLEGLRAEIVSSKEVSIGNHVYDSSHTDDFLPGEIPDTDGTFFSDSEVILSNEDGSRWVKNGDDEYALMTAYTEKLVVGLDDAPQIYALYIYQPQEHDEDDRNLSDDEMVHDFVNLCVKLLNEDKITGINLTRGIDYRLENTERNLSDVRVNIYVASHISVKDIVRLIKTGKRAFGSIWAKGQLGAKTLGMNDVHGLMFLNDCVEAGILDADDLAEWADHVDDPEWIMSNVSPTLLMYAKKHSPYLFRRHKNAAETFASMFSHLMSYSDEVIPALTGSSPAKPARHVDKKAIPEITGDTFSGHLGANFLKNPRVQVEVIKRSNPEMFLTELSMASNDIGYIPLSKEAVDYMMMNAKPDDRQNVAGQLINYYYILVLKSKNRNQMDTRTRKMLFDEINRNIDERIRNEAQSFNDQVQMLTLATSVPGFEMPERYGDDIGHSLSQTKTYRGAVSAPHLLRILGRMEHQHSSKDEMLQTFMELCLGEPIRKEYEARTPIGKRLRTMFMSFAAKEQHLDEGQKGTPRDADKLWPFTLNHITHYFYTTRQEFSKFFEIYLNGKDADVSRLYSVKSSQITLGRDTSNLFYGLLNTFNRVFNEDEMTAVNAFFSPRGGLLSCTSTEFVEVPGAAGKKGNRRPVQKDEVRVRLAIASGLANSMMLDEDTYATKSFLYVVNECLAGQHLILSPEADVDETVGKLLFLSGFYDKFDKAEGDTSKNIVEISDLDEIIMNSPGKLLKYVRSLPQTLASKLCTQYFTAETVRNMSRTKDGLKLFLDIADLGQMGDAEWDNFAAAFAAGNANNIKNLIKSLPADEGGRLMSKLSKYLNAANNSTSSKFTAVSGSEVNSQLGSTIQYSMANGLRWMKGYVTQGKPSAMSEDGKAGLYSAEGAASTFGNVVDGWRLPTVDEILHLGDNPDTISEEALGFTGTGMADADGELISGSEDFCFAWCMGPDGPVGYSVDSNNVIEVNDSNIEPGYLLAIKLVR